MSHTVSTAVWTVNAADPSACASLARSLDLSPLVARVLVGRGLADPEAAGLFLAPNLAHLHDPFLMKDMDRAAALLARAIAARDPVLVYGDYDADGITGTALLVRAIRDLGGQADFRLPHRLREGYGLNPDAVAQAAAAGVKVLVTVDCGTTDFDAVAAARAAGLTVIVTDHHQPEDRLPQADALLNPRRRGCPYPFKDLAGVGVAFKLVCGLLHEMGIETQSHLKFLDLVTLGTVGDVVPLLGENRVLVRFGLPRLARSRKLGVAALLRAAGLGDRPLTSRDVAYLLAPRLNAAGRMADPRDSVDLLLTRDRAQADALAERLCRLNDERRDEDLRTLEQAQQMAAALDLDRDRAIVLASEGWHPGVVGIVASRLVERFHRPTLLIAVRDGIGKGSGRSIGPFHLWRALNRCAHLLVRFGGHRHAAGFTVEAPRIDALRDAFGDIARAELTPDDLVPVRHVDAWADLSELTVEAVSSLDAMAPFGTGNPEPVLATKDVTIEQISTCGADNQHLRLGLRQERRGAPLRAPAAPTPHPAAAAPAIWFGQGPLAGQLEPGQRLDVCYRPELDDWNGPPSARLKLDDAAADRPLAPPGVSPADSGQANGASDANGQHSLF